MTGAALRRARRDALRLHEARQPRLDPSVDTLEALDCYEQEHDRWLTEWLRLRLALETTGGGAVGPQKEDGG